MPKGKTDFGKPLYNLEIDLSLSKTSFTDGHVKAINQIWTYGKAVDVARRFFGSEKHVTECGYLLSGRREGIETRKEVLDIDDNVPDLFVLDRILREGKEDGESEHNLHIDFGYNAIPVRVRGRYLKLDT